MDAVLNHIEFVYDSLNCKFHTVKVKGKVFYGQEPQSGESTITECGSQLATSCSNLLK